jgi:hypothetical protein
MTDTQEPTLLSLADIKASIKERSEQEHLEAADVAERK